MRPRYGIDRLRATVDSVPHTSCVTTFFDQCHLTPHGSRIVAPLVYELLRDSVAAKRPTGGQAPRGRIELAP